MIDLESIYSDIAKGVLESEVAYRIFDGILHMQRADQEQEINDLLDRIDLTRLNVTLMLSFAMATFGWARSTPPRLCRRADYMRRVEDNLVLRGEQQDRIKRLLDGLIIP